MTEQRETMTHEFVEFISDELDEGVVYVSIRYRVATHLCPCGCGERVVTPLHPAQWALSYDGETVSLKPSIGGGGCNSHYFITRGRVRWAVPLTDRQRGRAAQRDQAALGIGSDEWPGPDDDAESRRPEGPGGDAEDGHAEGIGAATKRTLWGRLKSFFAR